MEKEISEKEYALKKAKSTKRKATPGASTAPAASNPDVIEIDDDTWSIPSEDEGPKAAKGGAKAVKDTSERDAATAARKALREREQSWKKEVGKASKCIQMLHSVCASMTLARQVRQTTSRGWGRAEEKPQGRIGQAAEVQEQSLVSTSFLSAVCPL